MSIPDNAVIGGGVLLTNDIQTILQNNGHQFVDVMRFFQSQTP